MSPFCDYSTWISGDTKKDYQSFRRNHDYPSKEDIEKANSTDLAKVREVLGKEPSQWYEKIIGVDANKINAAIGTQRGTPQQNTVMKCKAQTVGSC